MQRELPSLRAHLFHQRNSLASPRDESKLNALAFGDQNDPRAGCILEVPSRQEACRQIVDQRVKGQDSVPLPEHREANPGIQEPDDFPWRDWHAQDWLQFPRAKESPVVFSMGEEGNLPTVEVALPRHALYLPQEILDGAGLADQVPTAQIPHSLRAHPTLFCFPSGHAPAVRHAAIF